jgi:DUF1365 family protein
VRISLHRDHQPAFVATLRGTRRPGGIGQLLRLQVQAPLAPLAGRLGMRLQGATLWLRRVPVAPAHAPGVSESFQTSCPAQQFAMAPPETSIL